MVATSKMRSSRTRVNGPSAGAILARNWREREGERGRESERMGGGGGKRRGRRKEEGVSECVREREGGRERKKCGEGCMGGRAE
jgi:hypothetical protein